MPRSVEQLLRDAIEINGRVQEMTAGITLDQYSESRMLQLAVERSQEIVGEALRQLRDKNPELIARVDGYHSFVSLRHIIAHRYAVLEDEILWVTATNALPRLSGLVESILTELRK